MRACHNCVFRIIVSAGALLALACGAQTAHPNTSLDARDDCAYQLPRSRNMIAAILADLRAAYTMIGGGGISRIGEEGPGKYVVHLPQDEREDLLTYDLTIDSAWKVAVLSVRRA